ncbi:hypothetical protein M8J76_012486 [Diaphorina citri]|nr:hypothetical protein M8J75_000439 [Diaphorina citri]KAI5701066.1 hypothetical protein M8J75_005772 [Diaphorina citri]KAI5719596.1 hypothetical protein M8J76_012261 [Diaphorina citri]KAI5724347.1 hypothetical protein M8J77_001673 [Diaphorina citri]KAI5730329.1 hypothetical protein M8J76_012486 [Diaphorina citri]
MDRLVQFEEGLARVETLLQAATAAHSSSDTSTPQGIIPLIQGMFDILKLQFLGELKHLREELVNQSERIDRLETYSRRQCVLVHGIAEADAQTESQCMEVTSRLFRDKLGVAISPQQMDRAHRLGPIRTGENTRPRPVIVKLHSYLDKREIFTNKRKLKDSRILITESLTKTRIALLKRAREHFGPASVWTNDGKIIIKSDMTPGARLLTVTSERELARAIAQDTAPRNPITTRRR